MKQEDEIKLSIQKCIDSINIPIIDFESIRQRVNAKLAYKNQTEDKKKLPFYRFWKHHKTPLSLTEQCALFIAEQVVKSDINYKFNKLPTAINNIIDLKIQQIRENIEYEGMLQKTDEALHAQQITFDSSLKGEYLLKPR